MNTKIQFSDLDAAQCHVLFNIAFEDYTVYDVVDQNEPFIYAYSDILRLNTDNYQLVVKLSGVVDGGRDRTGDSAEYSPCEIDGYRIRKLLRQYNVNIYTETEFISWLRTQRNHDQSPTDNFFGTYLMGPYHYATVYRKTEHEPYTYIVHGEDHDPKKEFSRSNDFDEFLKSLDKVNAMSLEDQEREFAVIAFS